MKFKGFSGVKTHEGERYVFKKGIATVPGMWFQGKPLLITFPEYKSLTGLTVPRGC